MNMGYWRTSREYQAAKHLSETRWPWLRTRPVRRGLAVAMLAVCAAMIATGFLLESRAAAPWWLWSTGLMAMIGLNWALSSSLRWLSNTSEHQLDEFQRLARLQARAWAYPIVGIGSVLALLLVTMGYQSADATSVIIPDAVVWFSGFGALLFVTSLPNMRLAWSLPEEC